MRNLVLSGFKNRRRVASLLRTSSFLALVFCLHTEGALAWQAETNLALIKQMLTLQNEAQGLKRSQPDVAIENLEKVIEIQREIHGPDTRVVLRTLEEIAELKVSLERWESAILTWEGIYKQRVATRGKDHWQSIDARIALDKCRTLSTFSDAQREEFADAQRLVSLGNVLFKFGQYGEAMETLEKGLQQVRKTFGEEDLEFAKALNLLAGLCQKYSGDFDRAESLFQQSLNVKREVLGEAHPDYASTLNNLAGLYELKGDYARAEPLYREALGTLLMAHLLPDLEYATTLNNLGNLYSRMGDYPQAKRTLIRSLEIRKELYEHVKAPYATTLINLANVCCNTDDYKTAEKLLLYARDLQLKTIGKHHPKYAAMLNMLATVYKQSGNPQDAKSVIQECLEIQKKALGESHPSCAITYSNLAVFSIESGDYVEAESNLLMCKKIEEKHFERDHPDYALTQGKLATLYQRMGDYARAEPLANQAINSSVRSLEKASIILSQRQQLAMQQVLRNRVDEYLSLALNEGQQFRNKAAGFALTTKGATLARQRSMRIAASDPAIRNQFSQLQQVSRQLATLSRSMPAGEQRDRWKRRITSLTEKKERLEAELSRDSVEFREAQKAVTARSIQQSLPQDTVAVDFLQFAHTKQKKAEGDWVYTTTMLATIVKRDRELQLIDLGSVAQLTKTIDTWRATKGTSEEARQAGIAIRKQIWEPLLEHINGANTILISADGVLGQMPLAALPGKEPGTYLIEDHRIAMIPVPRMIPELVEVERSSESKGELLLLGDVDYEASPAGDLSSDKQEQAGENSPTQVIKERFTELPGAADEVAAIEALHRRLVDADSDDVKVLKRSHASETEFRKLAGNYRVLHLATHGFFAPPEIKSALGASSLKRSGRSRLTSSESIVTGMNPDLLSGLVFAGANLEPVLGEDDGILTAQEIAFLPLDGVETAVLSACQTGLGEVAGGEGLIGIQRAFQVAGVRTTVASLWKVDDQATRKLMELFYTNLLEKKMTKLDALREAQLQILNYPECIHSTADTDQKRKSRTPAPSLDVGGNKRTDGRGSPELWAAFQLSGDWR